MTDDTNVPAAEDLRRERMAWRSANDAMTVAADLLEAIDALHQRPEPPVPQDQWPTDAWFVPWCSTCSVLWPCPTRLLLHPEEADRD